MIGFIINPIAGMGGRVALKGTDGVVAEAIRRGSKPMSSQIALRFLSSLNCKPHFMTVSGDMGANSLRKAGFDFSVVYSAGKPTSADDTKNAVRAMIEKGAKLIVFTGGDGTARDVVSADERGVPVLGIPSGVKMFSSCFALDPESAARILCEYMKGSAVFRDSEILDIDEAAYRRGKLEIKLYASARTPYIAGYVQNSKEESFGGDEESAKDEIAEYILDIMEDGALYILGPGTTTMRIAEKMGEEKTPLGVDAYFNGKIVLRDAGEKELRSALLKYGKAKIIVSPIGSQGFIFGRGNQQISADIIRKAGKDSIIVVATPQKMEATPELHIYTGDRELDKMFRGYVRVITGYNRMKMKKIT